MPSRVSTTLALVTVALDGFRVDLGKGGEHDPIATGRVEIRIQRERVQREHRAAHPDPGADAADPEDEGQGVALDLPSLVLADDVGVGIDDGGIQTHRSGDALRRQHIGREPELDRYQGRHDLDRIHGDLLQTVDDQPLTQDAVTTELTGGLPVHGQAQDVAVRPLEQHHAGAQTPAVVGLRDPPEVGRARADGAVLAMPLPLADELPGTLFLDESLNILQTFRG